MQLLDIYILLAHIVGVFILYFLEDIEGVIEIFDSLRRILAQILNGRYVDKYFACTHLTKIFTFIPSFYAQ